ncbi:MAG: LysR family transcriptional regulator [Clostridia bacterium]|nr:LysR family transcriptional regulator [Clostridia bacterium]
MNISYDHYKVFYYVAKYRNITAAARALMSNQPNVTRMIKKLEDELGCTLFVRHRNGVSPTPEGEKLYAHVAVACEHILLAEQQIAGERSLSAGVVSVAASEIALHCALLPVLKAYRKRYPGIRIRISNHSTPQAVDALKKGLVDFAVVTGPFELPPDIGATVLRTIREVAVYGSGLPIPPGTVLGREEFAAFPIVGLGEDTGSFVRYTAYFERMGLSYSADVEAATADQILPMVRSDLGIGFVPEEFLENERTENLIVPETAYLLPRRDICLLKRKDTVPGIAAAALVEELLAASRTGEKGDNA